MNRAREARPDAQAHGRQLPLVVDLNHTLIRTHLLWEALALFIRARFLELWRIPIWLLAGRSAFQRHLAHAAMPAAATLPYDHELLAFLHDERRAGRRVVLLTDIQSSFAASIAAHVGLFDRIVAPDRGDISGTHAKAKLMLDAYGDRGFDYIGYHKRDHVLWRHSRLAYSVARQPIHIGNGRFTTPIGAVRGGRIAALFKTLRPRQWLKNLLVCMPMLAGHQISAVTALQSLLAFAAFSLCASSAYLLNDTLDVADDRMHPTKRHRPIAAGTLPIAVALGCSLLLAVASLLLCAAVSRTLLAVLTVYFVATVLYSLYLKRMLAVDVVTLAILYSMRILAGGAVTGIAPSFWLLAFSFFIFLSLALLKRHSELENLERSGADKTAGRGYTVADKGPIGIMGINSAFLSVLVFILYVESQNALIQYKSPIWLAGIVPLLVFWLSRLWILSYRGRVDDDPVLYVSRDRVSLALFALCFVLTVAAT
ncbi:UbiA family prenyltransferase [Massilia pinisoli]|uniref:UbiA family prenyltransferase n=1 Tax=Massilia pinisoli TaxID=1772194 RepID=A0ABT1ZTE2_9BURK|nr:UbiA family prenyltransferase [Massilia pinisoli]MCS0583188.1 UbiA family prenyltransferase [Massilia pinisoli]